MVARGQPHCNCGISETKEVATDPIQPLVKAESGSITTHRVGLDLGTIPGRLRPALAIDGRPTESETHVRIFGRDYASRVSAENLRVLTSPALPPKRDMRNQRKGYGL